jgi:hypothetical protein
MQITTYYSVRSRSDDIGATFFFYPTETLRKGSRTYTIFALPCRSHFLSPAR